MASQRARAKADRRLELARTRVPNPG
jgi:hypothetical protein